MPTLTDIAALAKRRGFIFPGSELYGGLANTYDYGPLGVELKRNIKALWWKVFIVQRPEMVGLDTSIISNEKIWAASGHLAGFADAMVDCRTCRSRTRADHLIENYFKKKNQEKKVEGLPLAELTAIIRQHKIPCPSCGGTNFTAARAFNLLFPVQLGIIAGEDNTAYLRGETAQGIFVNFKNILASTRVRLPFGVGQLGKSFRNEITRGQLTFRTVEFEQGEIEYFFDPEQQSWQKLFADWLQRMQVFVTENLGISPQHLRVREHSDAERSFYSRHTVDLEYQYPFGFQELWGLAYRTDYDLRTHAEHSGKDLAYTDPASGKKFFPHVIEPAVGIDRMVLMVLCEAYWEDKKNRRVVLKLKPELAPYSVAVFPLVKNKPELVARAASLRDRLSPDFRTAWDERGNIGKRYYYQDEMGTPFCVTVDHQTLEDETVTVRDRDTTKQERVSIAKLTQYLQTQLKH